MSNLTTLNNTKSLVPVKYYEIFALRIIGLTYKQIANKTNYSEDRIKHLFYSKGVLCELWLSWVETAKKESIDEAIDMMFGHLPDIMRANILHAKSQSVGAVLARKIIFEYTLGKPEDRIKLDAKVGIFTFADWIKQQTLLDQENKQANEGENS